MATTTGVGSASARQWEMLVRQHPTAVQCERCGRWLYSKESIERGYGQRCAWLQALEGLSQAKPLRDVAPPVEFQWKDQSATIMEILRPNGTVCGRLEKDGQNRWWIWVWRDRVDFDTSLFNAKLRATRIFQNMTKV